MEEYDLGQSLGGSSLVSSDSTGTSGTMSPKSKKQSLFKPSLRRKVLASVAPISEQDELESIETLSTKIASFSAYPESVKSSFRSFNSGVVHVVNSPSTASLGSQEERTKKFMLDPVVNTINLDINPTWMAPISESKHMVLVPEDISAMRSVIICILQLINIFIVPYRIFVDSGASNSWMGIELSIDMVHLIVISLSFFIPYTKEGSIITNSRDTAMHYFHTFFIYDVLAALPMSLPQWFLFGGNTYWRVVKLLPTSIYQHFGRCQDSSLLLSRCSPYGMLILFQACSGATIIHICSCLWVCILRSERHNSESHGAFVVVVDDADLFDEFTTVQMYFKGIEWSIKHLIGYGVHSKLPHTDLQVLFMQGVALAGLYLYTYFLATVSSFVNYAAANNKGDRLRTKLDDVTSVCNKLRIPQNLYNEIKGYYIHVYKVASSVNVDGKLSDLPPMLLDKVNYEVSKGILAKMPMFKQIQCPVLIEELVAVMHPKVFLPNLRIVAAGSMGTEMLFVWSGEIKVVNEAEETVQILGPGDNYGEVALLTPVKRLTSLITTSYTTVFVLTRQVCFTQSPSWEKKQTNWKYSTKNNSIKNNAHFNNKKDFKMTVKKFPELLPVVNQCKQGLQTLDRRGTLPESTIHQMSSFPSFISKHVETADKVRGSLFRNSSASTVLSDLSSTGSEFLGRARGESRVGAFLLSASASFSSTASFNSRTQPNRESHTRDRRLRQAPAQKSPVHSESKNAGDIILEDLMPS